MRLSMIAPFPPYRGGVSQFATSSWEAMIDAGHELQALSFTRRYPRFLFPRISRYEATPTQTPGPVHRVIDAIGPWTWRIAARRIAEFAPDVVFVHHWTPLLAPAYRSILVKTRAFRPATRSIALVHDAIPNEPRPFDQPLNRWFLDSVDGCMVLSEEVERDLWALGRPRRIRRIHHPTYDRFGSAPSREEAREQLGIASDTPLLLFFGYVRPYKGLGVLLKAFAETRSRLPELRLLVAGEFHEDERRYRNMMSDLGVARAVDMRNGFVPDDEVATLFAACDVVVQPYLTANYSGVAKVAFHFERPMIMTDVGGLAGLVDDGHAGLVVPPDDSEALAQAIHRFFDENLADELTGGVRARKAEFSWDRLVEAFEELADEIRG
jgi:glycosyltransferase involved in cell wall biosynthesis